MDPRRDAALDRLVGDGTLTGAQAAAVRAALDQVDRPAMPEILTEVGGYVGGVFVLAAGVVLASTSWSSLSRSDQVLVLALPALAVLGGAVTVLATTAGGWPVRDRAGAGPRRRMAAALTCVAAVLAALAVVVGVDPGGEWGPAVFGATALVVVTAGYVACRCALLHLACVAALALTVYAGTVRVLHAGQQYSAEPTVPGLALLAVAALWFGLTRTGWLVEHTLGTTSAAVLTFGAGESVAAQSGAVRNAGYLVLVLLAAAALASYVRTRVTPVLVVGVVALAAVVPQAVLDWTDGALGAAGALLLTGLSIVGASLLGLRLRGRNRPPSLPPAAAH